MIGYIEGNVLHIDEKKILLKTALGLGYEVYYSGYCLVGDFLNLYTSQIIREQSQDIFGFKSLGEKELFNLLLGVTGVGPKSAYSLVMNVGVESVKKAIVLEEKKVLTTAPGIGPKAAAQIILNLQEKISKAGEINLKAAASFTSPVQGKVLDEVILACQELGFRESEVLAKVSSWLKDDPEASSEVLIKKVLQEVAR